MDIKTKQSITRSIMNSLYAILLTTLLWFCLQPEAEAYQPFGSLTWDNGTVVHFDATGCGEYSDLIEQWLIRSIRITNEFMINPIFHYGGRVSTGTYSNYTDRKNIVDENLNYAWCGTEAQAGTPSNTAAFTRNNPGPNKLWKNANIVFIIDELEDFKIPGRLHHEWTHFLGLGHENNLFADSIMAINRHWSDPVQYNRMLLWGYDDLKGLQFLYGSRMKPESTWRSRFAIDQLVTPSVYLEGNGVQPGMYSMRQLFTSPTTSRILFIVRNDASRQTTVHPVTGEVGFIKPPPQP